MAVWLDRLPAITEQCARTRLLVELACMYNIYVLHCLVMSSMTMMMTTTRHVVAVAAAAVVVVCP